MKNTLIKWLIKPKIKPAPENKERFLIVSTTGLGDTLWATPAIRALRQSFPNSYIGVLTTPFGKRVLQKNRHIDEFFVLKKPHLFSSFSLYFALKKRKIASVLLFHASQRLIFPLCALLQAPLIGTKGQNKGLDFLFSKLLDHPPVHEIERRLKIVQAVGAVTLNSLLEFSAAPEDEKELHSYLEKQSVLPHLPLIALHPGSKDGFKRWPEEHFIEVGTRLMQHLGAQIIVTGDASEKFLVERVAGKIPGALAVAGSLSLGALGALLSKLALMITNDTGPMHMAFAMQTPTVALFSPTRPELCGPYHAKNCTILAKNPTCNPCLRKKCADAFCLLQISPQEVYDAALNLFYKKP